MHTEVCAVSGWFVETAHSWAREADDAVRELRSAFSRQPDAVLFFCSPSYDLGVLGSAIARELGESVAGCTSAGQIGPSGYQKGGISAIAFHGDGMHMRPYLIDPLSQCQELAAEAAARARAQFAELPNHKAFGLILVDGLSFAEERLTAALYQSMTDVPIIGGSAGDDLAFERTYVYHEGRFRSDAALFVVFQTVAPFSTFKLHHFRPTNKRLVVTDADPARRLIREFNGEPAALAYAEAIGVDPGRLDAGVFSSNPVLVNVGGELYVRSLQRRNDDHSLTLYCAIEEGLVLSVGEGTDPVAAMERAFEGVRAKVEPEVVLGCDCILRRVELEQKGIDANAGKVLAANRVFGFSTYGEQFNSIHVNQTFTGVAIGRSP